MRKLIGTSLLFCWLSSCGENAAEILEASAMGLAKEMCTCIFVVGQSEQNCRESNKEAFIVGKMEVDNGEKTVVGRGLGYQAKAQYRSSAYGCKVLESGKI